MNVYMFPSRTVIRLFNGMGLHHYESERELTRIVTSVLKYRHKDEKVPLFKKKSDISTSCNEAAVGRIKKTIMR